jgi:hypothetical protein
MSRKSSYVAVESLTEAQHKHLTTVDEVLYYGECWINMLSKMQPMRLFGDNNMLANAALDLARERYVESLQRFWKQTGKTPVERAEEDFAAMQGDIEREIAQLLEER